MQPLVSWTRVALSLSSLYLHIVTVQSIDSEIWLQFLAPIFRSMMRLEENLWH